ncbi:unnamed protein product [Brassicogethes aeneus]|uniref:G-protein coupled receptors family 1 profile domain-containing protein n=1 Tax=Brassicogethes aeneus TaxID=1431903 RepID=A0A9P0FDZ8_BRAAE|nr:unnamed protein product [Brassicogethes aeneus]
MGYIEFFTKYVFGDFTVPDRGDGNVWKDEPTLKGTIIYSVIVPILCVFGVFANALCLMVLRKAKLSASVYTYLSVLALVDLMGSILLLLAGLSNGALWYEGWGYWDALVGVPLQGTVNCLGVCAVIFVMIDRVTYLWDSHSCAKPPFCDPLVARKVMGICFFVSVLVNVPYCFIFRADREGHLVNTPFFDSREYGIYNWCYFIIFCIISSIILIMGNGFLIFTLKKAEIKNAKLNCKKRMDHRHLTTVLIMIILVFLLAIIPTNLTSRTSAINILFHGDHYKAHTKEVEIVRQVCALIGAINFNANFVLYYVFCPCFYKAMMLMFRRKKRVSKVEVNVYILEGGVKGEKEIIGVSERGFDTEDLEDKERTLNTLYLK